MWMFTARDILFSSVSLQYDQYDRSAMCAGCLGFVSPTSKYIPEDSAAILEYLHHLVPLTPSVGDPFSVWWCERALESPDKSKKRHSLEISLESKHSLQELIG